MALRKINESTLTAIGNAIRSKTGGSALINPEDMASEIEGIPSGGGVEHGLEILTFDSNGLPETAKVYGETTRNEFRQLWYGINKRVEISLEENVTHIAENAFYLASVGINQASLNRIKTADASAFAFLSGTALSLAQETLYLPEFTGGASASAAQNSRFKSSDTSYYKKIHCPKMQQIGTYDFQNPRTPSWEREIGSVGFPVTTVGQRPFYYAAVAGTVTIYVNPSELSTISAAVENGVSAGVVTFIYKSSIDGEVLQTNVR